jgi:hypothetical protein
LDLKFNLIKSSCQKSGIVAVRQIDLLVTGCSNFNFLACK